MAIAYDQYAGIFNEAAGNEVGVADHRNNALGIQAELEERMDAWAVSGVISGGACTIDGVNVAVATIDAYAAGKRYNGADSYAFSGDDAADTYYLYMDPTDDTTPLTRGTSAASGDELPLCSVAWNGTDALSALVDLRAWGILRAQYSFQVIGAVSADVIGLEILASNFWVEGASASLENCGSGAGPTLIDVHGGDGGSEATILTAAGDRISIAHDATDGVVAVAGDFDATGRKLTAGQKLLIEVDAASTAAADLCVIVYGRLY